MQKGEPFCHKRDPFYQEGDPFVKKGAPVDINGNPSRAKGYPFGQRVLSFSWSKINALLTSIVNGLAKYQEKMYFCG